MKTICVYSGSSTGSLPEFAEAAKQLGEVIARNGFGLVYGGSNTGLMGVVADAVLETGGEVTGVMPKGLFRAEVSHRGITKQIEVKDMHERKATMMELADAFVALPGGYGTFEELFEVICWSQIGLHDKPIGLLNTNGFYDPLVSLVDHAVESGFIHASNKALFVIDANPEALIEKLKTYEKPETGFQRGNG